MNISRSLKFALINADMKQKDLALKIGMPRAYISAMVTGHKSASINFIVKCSDGLDMKVSEFIALGED